MGSFISLIHLLNDIVEDWYESGPSVVFFGVLCRDVCSFGLLGAYSRNGYSGEVARYFNYCRPGGSLVRDSVSQSVGWEFNFRPGQTFIHRLPLSKEV